MAERKKQYSPETLEKLSKLAKQRHAEGKLGGREFGKLGGRPRKERATKAVAEAARDEEARQQLIDVFKDGIHPSQPMATRLKAAEAWLRVDEAEGKAEIQEQEMSDRNRSRGELLDILAEKLTTGASAQLLAQRLMPAQDDDVVDADVVEDDQSHAA